MCSTFNNTGSYLSRLDCGKASKPSGNMVLYKPYQTSAFILAMFDHYKANHHGDDVALQSDCGHQTKEECSSSSSRSNGRSCCLINHMIHQNATEMSYLCLSYISVRELTLRSLRSFMATQDVLSD